MPSQVWIAGLELDVRELSSISGLKVQSSEVQSWRMQNPWGD
jgi:hypothetical protein